MPEAPARRGAAPGGPVRIAAPGGPARGAAPEGPAAPARARVAKSKFGSYYYPTRPELLDRKALVCDLRRLERKLHDASLRRAAVERRAASARDSSARTARDRDLMLRLERAWFAHHERLLAALGKYDAVAQCAAAPDAPRERLRDSRELLRDSLRRSADGLTAYGIDIHADRRSDDGLAESDDWISEDLVRAYADVGADVSRRVEACLYGEMRQHLVNIGDDGRSRREKLLEADNARLATDVLRLQSSHNGLERAAAQQARDFAVERSALERRFAVDALARRQLIAERADRRALRDSALDLVGELAAGIHKRLGFLPESARKEINVFIDALQHVDGDDRLLPAPPRGAPAHDTSMPPAAP